MAKSATCVTCGNATSKYPCKSCDQQTCSLACFKAHEAPCLSLKVTAEPSISPAPGASELPTAAHKDSTATLKSSRPRYTRPLRSAYTAAHPPLPASTLKTLLKRNPALRGRLNEYHTTLLFARHSLTSDSSARHTRADVAWDMRRASSVAGRSGSKSRSRVKLEDGDEGVAQLVDLFRVSEKDEEGQGG